MKPQRQIPSARPTKGIAFPESSGFSDMAAMSENPELSGKAIPFVGLAEGICLWGFIVALMILSA